MENMKLFDRYAAEIFARLYKAFPVPIPLEGPSISGHTEIDRERHRASKR